MNQTNSKNDFTLEITALSYGPYGIGRTNGQVIMIPETVPGDRVRARLREAKKNYSIGEMVELLEPSSRRCPPPCPHVRECGGCPWQQVRYESQLQAKQRNVADALKRIGRIDTFELRPIIPSPEEYHYRRRVRFQCDNERRLGFFRPFSHDLVEIQCCPIAEQPTDALIPVLRRWVQRLQTLADQLEIVAGDQAGELVVVLSGQKPFIAADDATCRGLLQEEPRICGVIFHGHERRAWGQTRLNVMIEDGINLFVEADIFIQVNREGNRTIVRELLAAGEIDSSDRVLELYCGAGNFTLPLAKRAREIVAVEGHRPSIECGKRSAQINALANIRWIAADAPAAAARLRQKSELFSKIVLNPPRTGAKGFERELAAFGAERILYVSCNPTTLARDVSALAGQGYKLQMVQPVDLFPQTFHVETLAMMTR